MALGNTLRENRLRRNMSTSDVAAATRMKTQTVDALESEDFRQMPAPIYSKGFIRLYAECLGLDPEPLVREYVERFMESPSRPVQTERVSVLEVPDAHSDPAPVVSPPASAQRETPVSSEPEEHDLFSYARSRPVQEAKPVFRPAPPPEPVRPEPADEEEDEEGSRVSEAVRDRLAGGYAALVGHGTAVWGKMRTAAKQAADGCRPERLRQAVAEYGTPRTMYWLSVVTAVAVVVLLVVALWVRQARTELPAQDMQEVTPEPLRVVVPPPEPYLR